MNPNRKFWYTFEIIVCPGQGLSIYSSPSPLTFEDLIAWYAEESTTSILADGNIVPIEKWNNQTVIDNNVQIWLLGEPSYRGISEDYSFGKAMHAWKIRKAKKRIKQIKMGA